MAVWSFDGVGSAIFPYWNFAPGLAVRGSGRITEFDVVQPTRDSGYPSALEQNWQDPTAGHTTWQNYTNHLAGPNVLSAPVAVSRPDNPGRVYVFAIGQLDWSERSRSGPVGLIYWNWGLPAGAATDGWVPIVSLPLPASAGAVAQVQPAAVAWAPGRVDVFAVSTQGTLLHWWLNEGESQVFNGPEPLQGSGVIGSPAAVSWTPYRLDVFASSTGGLLHWWFDQSNGNEVFFGSPEFLGQASSPCAVSWAPNRLDVFANTGNGIGHWWYDATGTPIQSFNVSSPPPTLGGSNNCGPPAAASWGPGRFDVFASNSQGQLQHWWQDQGSGTAGLDAPDALFATFQPPGNTVTTFIPPACASGGVGNLEVVAVATVSELPILDHWRFS